MKPLKCVPLHRGAVTWLAALTVLAAAAADEKPAGTPPRAVFHAAFASSLSGTGSEVGFERASEATYFDPQAERLVTVPTNTPRFVTERSGKKPWGVGSGVFLEGPTRNLLLDSSFEGALTNWTFEGGIARQAGVGIHGGHGLEVKGPATLSHQPVSVRIFPERCTYLLSIYVRRADGGDLSPHDVVCDGRPAVGSWDAKQNRMLPVAKLGAGPWHRVSAFIGNWESQQRGTPPETNAFVHSFRFRGGAFHVDAAQLEWNPSTPNHYWVYFGPSSYVPTLDAPAERAQDIMWAPTGDLLPGKAWSISFWRYALPPSGSQHGPVFGLWDESRGAPKPVLTVSRERAAGADIAQDHKPGWNFITLTSDGDKMNVFVNGISKHDKNGPFEFKLPAVLPEKAYWAGPWRSDLYASMGLLADFSTWGRALTAEEVAGLYATGSPVVQPASRFPVTFKLDKPGKVSINAYDSTDRLVHQVVVGRKFEAGEHTVDWDGCDRDGQPVPVGRYTFRGIAHNVRSVYDGKICNTSPSPGGEWKQYRTGHYYDVAALPDGGIATVSAWGEHGRVVQVIDGPPDYPVRWSANAGYPGVTVAVAADSNYVYTVTTHWLENQTLARDSLFRWDIETGAKVPFTTREGLEMSPQGSLWLDEARPKHGGWSLATGWDSRTDPYTNIAVRGIAARNGRVYVALHGENRIATLDGETGAELASTPCDAPRKIALDRDGHWFVTGSNGVYRLDATGRAVRVVSDLTNPSGIAVGPDGKLYVTELEPLHQVKVYGVCDRPDATDRTDRSHPADQHYSLLRVFGKEGGHQGGRIAPDILDNPLGIGVTGDGAILLTDLGSQRVMVHDPDFGVRKLIHGMMSHQMSVSEVDPSLAYAWWPHTDLWEYRIDPVTRIAEPSRRWMLAREGVQGFGFYRRLIFREWNGRTFAIDPGNGSVVEMAGDRLIPRLKLGAPDQPPLTQTIEDRTGWKPDAKALASVKWQWRDANGDGKVQASEYTFFEGLTNVPGNRFSFGSSYNFVSPQHDIYAASSYTWTGLLRFPFGGLDTNGCPIYSWDTAQSLVHLKEPIRGLDGKGYEPAAFSAAADDKGNSYLGIWHSPFSRPFAQVRLRKYSPEGNLVWEVGEKATTVWRPGSAIGMPIVGFVDNKYMFMIDYHGSMDVWDTDGLFVTRLFDDLPPELRNNGETLGGAAFRHPDGTVYAYSAPDCTYHITGIRVEGLGDIKRFGGRIEVSAPPWARRIEDRTPTWTVLRRTEEILVDGEINPREWGTDTDTQAPQYFMDDGAEVARAWAQWDDEALYLAWRIRDESPAVNKRTGRDRYLSDQVEFMLRASTEEASGRYTPEDYQLAIGPDGDGCLGVYVQLNATDKRENMLEGAAVGLHINSDRKGYTMEARIPWASLGAYRPTAGDNIRWSMNVCFGDELGENLQRHVKWKPGIHQGPANWGKALFR